MFGQGYVLANSGIPVDGVGPAPRVFISYAQETAEHVALMTDFWLFLRANGVDAQLDTDAAQQPQNWPTWMLRQVRDSDFVLLIASAAYKRRADGDAGPTDGRGVQWEARLIQEEYYRDQETGPLKFLPVVLPGHTVEQIPTFCGPVTHTHYEVTEFSAAGAELLLRYLLGQPRVAPPVGAAPVFDQQWPAGAGAEKAAPESKVGPGAGVRTRVVVAASLAGDVLSGVTSADGHVLGHGSGVLPASLLAGEWPDVQAPAMAGARVAAWGIALAAAVFDPLTRQRLAGLVDGMLPGGGVDVVIEGDPLVAGLPWETLTLPGTGVGLVLRAGVTLCRVVTGSPLPQPVAVAGPVKVLAAVAAPDETKTPNRPLDVEAEMQAVLDATADPAGNGLVHILEVADLTSITAAVADTGYAVLHLSAHGSTTSLELEDEDGEPVPVTAAGLVDVLRRAGRPVPLIVLSSCSGGAGGAAGLAAGLISGGADRVLAMNGPVPDDYATRLAAALYRDLVAHPDRPVGQALAVARQQMVTQDSTQAHRGERVGPWWALAGLWTAAGDGPLIDSSLPETPLPAVPDPPAGLAELPVGYLIGRRAQVRDGLRILRHHPSSIDEFGAVGGVVYTGIGGIGKTAVARRVVTRLNEAGWKIAIHIGAWNPAGLLAAVAAAVRETDPTFAAALVDVSIDDAARLDLVPRLVANRKVLLVFDDFEANLTPGGEDYLDPGFADVLAACAHAGAAASGLVRGGLLITCRYPLPGEPGRWLAQIGMPPLSRAELSRMLRRQPALRDLTEADARLVIRVIGGHPRLIELLDALVRAGKSNLADVKVKLNALARATGIDPRIPADSMTDHLDAALVLGSADILLQDLLTLLTPEQRNVLAQVAACRTPVDPIDTARSVTGDLNSTPTAPLRHAIARLQDLTLLTPGLHVGMHTWTAQLVDNQGRVAPGHHARAEAMHYQRFTESRATYEDLVCLARHLAEQQQYDGLADLADQVVNQVLPGTRARLAFVNDIIDLTPISERGWILIADLGLQALLAIGDLPSATTHLQRIHDQITARAAADPTNTDWQRDLTVSHHRVGDLAQARGDLTSAAEHHQTSLDIAARLASADPTNTDWQRDLTVSHDKVGDLAQARGDLTSAAEHYQTSLDIAARLAAADPTNTGWQRDLTVSHDRVGDLAQARGDLTSAAEHYQTSLDIAARLAAADPTNTEWRDLIRISQQKVEQARNA